MRRLFQSPQTIAEYSNQLRRRLAGVLPPEKVDEVVAETEAHLSDTAADLRDEPDLYERQAVQRFVGVRRLAAGISRAWAPLYLRHAGTRTLQNAGALVAVAVVLFYVVIASWPALFPWFSWAMLPFIVGVGLCFVLALAACRHQLHRFVTGGLTLLILCTLWGGWKFASAPQFGLVSRFNAPTTLHWNDALYHATQRRVLLLEQGLRHFQAPHQTAPVDELQTQVLELSRVLDRWKRSGRRDPALEAAVAQLRQTVEQRQVALGKARPVDLLATAPAALKTADGVLIPSDELFPDSARATRDPR